MAHPSHTGDILRARNFMRQAYIEKIAPDTVTFNTLITVYSRALGLVRDLGSLAPVPCTVLLFPAHCTLAMTGA